MRLFPGKKSMELWPIVFMVLALLLLFVVIIFWGELGDALDDLLNRLLGIF